MVLMALNVFSRLDFLLFCFRRRENQNLENQTRFFSLFSTTELALVSLNLTRRNLDLFRHFSFSFLLALVSRPHLHARNPPPITPQELSNRRLQLARWRIGWVGWAPLIFVPIVFSTCRLSHSGNTTVRTFRTHNSC